MIDLNMILFNAINSLAGKSGFLDWLMIFFAKYLVFSIAVMFIYLFLKEKFNKKFLFIAVAFLISLGISLLIGTLTYTPRPFELGLGTNILNHFSDSSFPSDHATAMFSFAFALLFAGWRKQGILFVILGLLVSFARIFTGLHFPVDVLGSIILSFIVVSLIYLVWRKER